MSTYCLRRLLGDLNMYESQKDLASRLAVRATTVRDSIRRIHFGRTQKEKIEAFSRFGKINSQVGGSTLHAICDAKFQGGLTLEIIQRLRGQALTEHDITTDSLDAMRIDEFAHLFLTANPLPTASGGYLGLIVDVQQQIISREGMRPTIDLSRSANGWHIFEACWKARVANASKAVKNGCPNEITAIYRAVNALNKKLLPLKVKGDEFRLVKIGAGDLTKM